VGLSSVARATTPFGLGQDPVRIYFSLEAVEKGLTGRSSVLLSIHGRVKRVRSDASA